jgi:hypothetical protein
VLKAFANNRTVIGALFGLLCFSLAGCAGGSLSGGNPGGGPPGPNPTPTPTPAPTAHSVSVSWLASSSPNVVSYNVYRATTTSGPFTRVGNNVNATKFTDTGVQSGTYVYEVTAVDNSNTESAPSSPVTIKIP